jgi:glycosyltransferase involved in cell wall biosynthesis
MVRRTCSFFATYSDFMRVTLNAIPIQPGGGLTVVRGVLSSLRAVEPKWHLCVLTGNLVTHQTLIDDGFADHVEQVTKAQGAVGALIWQNTCLNDKLRALQSDALITINHFLANLAVPQIVYHLNLRRFCKKFRSHRPSEMVQEYLRDLMARRALKFAAANVFESRFLLDSAQATIGRPIANPRVAYIGLPEHLHALSQANSKSNQTSRRILTVTSAEPHKDNSTLLRMFAELCRRRPQEDWQLDIAGGMNPQAWLPYQELAGQLGILERVTWHGFCKSEKITDLMNQSLCVVLTSQLESFAMVALESMARGCPVVVADCSSMPESVGDAGLIAEAGNAASFADKVLELSASTALRATVIERGNEWIKPFRWRECGASFSRIVRDVMPKSGKTAKVA